MALFQTKRDLYVPRRLSKIYLNGFTRRKIWSCRILNFLLSRQPNRRSYLERSYADNSQNDPNESCLLAKNCNKMGEKKMLYQPVTGV